MSDNSDRARAVLERVAATRPARGPRGGELVTIAGVNYERIGAQLRRLDYRPKGKAARRALKRTLRTIAHDDPSRD